MGNRVVLFSRFWYICLQSRGTFQPFLIALTLLKHICCFLNVSRGSNLILLSQLDLSLSLMKLFIH